MNVSIADVVSPAPRRAWQRLYEADPTGLVSQSPAWTDGVCASGAYRDGSRLYRLSDGREMVLPLVVPTRLSRLVVSAGSMPAAYGFGGLLAEAAIDAASVQLVWADLQSNPLLRLRVRPNPLSFAAWCSGTPATVDREPRTAHVLDLEGGFDTVWTDRFDSRTRWGVRRAEREGLKVVRSTDPRQLDAFSDLFARSVGRWARKQNEPLWLADLRARRRDPMSKFATIARHCGDAFNLWVAWQGDEPVAAIIVLQAANAHYTRGVMNQELAGPTRANDLLHRRAIESACEAGCRSYHMGETGDSESLARFKRRFGAVAVDYEEYFSERLPYRRADRLARSAVKRIIGFKDA